MHILGSSPSSSSPEFPQANPNLPPGRSCQSHSPGQQQHLAITLGRPYGCPATRQAVCVLQSMCRRALSKGCSRCRMFSRFLPLAALQWEAGSSPGPLPPASLAPSRHLASSAMSSRGRRARCHKHPPSKQDAFSHGANISGTTGNVQLDYNALRKGHGEISVLYLELCLFSAG